MTLFSVSSLNFDGQLCCLMDIRKLPRKAVLRVLRSGSDASSIGTVDIETLPHLPLADYPQGLSEAFSALTLFHMKWHGDLVG